MHMTFVAILDFVNVAASVLSSVVLTFIAFMTHQYTRKSIALTVEFNNRTLVNQWNHEIIQTPNNIDFAKSLRPPIFGQPEDQLLFIYLNYVNARWQSYCKGFETKATWERQKEHVADWLHALDSTKMAELLNCGYSYEFSKEVLGALKNASTMQRGA